MAKNKKKNKSSISKQDLFKMEKSATRKALIDTGVYNIHKEKTHKDITKYTRKSKHKGKL